MWSLRFQRSASQCRGSGEVSEERWGAAVSRRVSSLAGKLVKAHILRTPAGWKKSLALARRPSASADVVDWLAGSAAVQLACRLTRRLSLSHTRGRLTGPAAFSIV